MAKTARKLMFAVKGSDAIERPSGEIAVGGNRL